MEHATVCSKHCPQGQHDNGEKAVIADFWLPRSCHTQQMPKQAGTLSAAHGDGVIHSSQHKAMTYTLHST